MAKFKKPADGMLPKRIFAAAMACAVTVSMMPAQIVHAAANTVTVEKDGEAAPEHILIEDTEAVVLTAAAFSDEAEDSGAKFAWSKTDNSNVLTMENDKTAAVTLKGNPSTAEGTAEVKVTATMSGEGGDTAESAGYQVTVAQPVRTVTVTPPSEETTVAMGKTLQLSAACKDGQEEKLLNAKVSWASGEEAVATVSEEGLVTPVKTGAVTITATALNGTEGSFELNVTQPVTKITVTPEKADVAVGQKVTLEAAAVPENASDKTVTWSSSEAATASVDENGVVTGVKAGSATITATAKDGSGQKATSQITVKAATTEITLTGDAAVDVGKKITLTAGIMPSDASDTLTWTSSDETVATVSDKGEVTGVAKGTAVIKAAATDGTGVFAEKEIKVVQPVTKITIPEKATVAQGKKITLTAEVEPEDADDKSVTWSETKDDSSAIEIDGETGEVTASAEASGTATVKATAKDGSKTESSECTITVAKAAASVSVEKGDSEKGEASEIGVGRNFQLKATVKDKEDGELTSTGVTWTSQDENIATVDEKGKVTGVREGTTGIVATAADGTGVASDAFAITIVKVAVDKITLNESTATIAGKGTKELKVTFDPVDATYQGLTWKSDNEEIATVEPGEGGAAIVTSHKAGAANITAVSTDDTTKEAVCKVTVTEQLVTAVTIAQCGEGSDQDIYYAGKEYQLVPEITPANALNQELEWSSDKPEAVSVDAAGKIKVLKEGIEATITAAAKDGSGKKGTIQITGTKKAVSGITLSEAVKSARLGESFQLTVNFNPADATNQEVTWKSGNTSVAKVENGTVTITGIGTADITAASVDNPAATATCKVTGEKIPVSLVTLSETAKTVKIGGSFPLTAAVSPENATYKDVKWESSNPSVASVEANGTVKALANGTANITAAADGVSSACTVTVVPDVVDPVGITLSAAELTILKGQSATVTAAVTPEDATDKNVTWTSSDEKVAAVAGGVISAAGKGTAVITAKTVNGLSAKCTVIVPEMTLNAKETVVQVKKSSDAVKIKTKYPSNDSVASYKSSNTKVVKVDNKGKIKGVKVGKATVTVTMKSGVSATYKVTVQKGKVTTKSLKLSDKKLTLLKGKKAALEVTRNPISATEKLKWSSSNKKVAAVSSKGKVTAKGPGTATITVKSANGKKASCKVTVPGVTLKKTSATIKVKKSTTIKIKSTVVKKDKVKSYQSSNTKVATVSSKGKVTGVKKGKATITVTMKSGATAAFKVTVK